MDAIDITATASEVEPAAGKSEEGGQRPGRTARAVALELLHPMRIWRGALLLWKALGSLVIALAGTIAVIVVAILLIQGLMRRTVAIEPISVPKELADKGYSPDVAAARLRDAMHALVARADARTEGPNIAMRGEVPDIVVPTVGISVDNIVTAIRGFLHSNRRRSVSGEFVIAEGRLWLRLRLNGKQIYASGSGGPVERPDALIAAAVPSVLKEIDPLVVAAYLLWYKDEQARALAILDQVLEGQIPSDWNQADPFVMKAAADINSRDYAAATAAAKEAIGLQPRYAPAHIVSGDVLKAQHQSDAALGEYRLALRLDPENSVAPTRIAGVLRAQKKTTEAAKYVRAVIAKHPRRPGYHVSLGWMLREQPDKVGADAEFDKAVTLYRERLQEDPDNAAIHEGLGEALHAARRLEEAAAVYREAISLEPRRAGPIRP